MHIQVINSQKTMTSREIAELTGKDHKNVLADIRKMLADLGSAENSANLPDMYGRPQPVLLLDKEQSLCLVAGYSAPLRMAIIKRWQELESKQSPEIPQTYAAALLEAGRLALELEQSQANLAIAAPKAEVFDRVIERDTLLNATQVAQQVGMSAVKMNRILDDMGGVYNQAVKRHRTFCHSWVSAGHGEMKLGEQGYPQALFTPKGALRVVEMLTSEGVI